MLFRDEAYFTRAGILNSHSNSRVIRIQAVQTRFIINVGIGIVGDHVVGPYHFFSDHLPVR